MEIQKLKKEVEYLKVENQGLGKIALVQTTWEWEAYLARFVVEPGIEITEECRFQQMKDHACEKNKSEPECFEIYRGKIQNNMDKRPLECG